MRKNVMLSLAVIPSLVGFFLLGALVLALAPSRGAPPQQAEGPPKPAESIEDPRIAQQRARFAALEEEVFLLQAALYLVSDQTKETTVNLSNHASSHGSGSSLPWGTSLPKELRAPLHKAYFAFKRNQQALDAKP